MMHLPRRITAEEWESEILRVPREIRKGCRSLRAIRGGIPYLAGPARYASKGDSLLLRLKYDSSFEALRLWSFLFSEKNRLFFAKENGWKIFAAMKDLGQVPVISYAVPESLTFYADELWWAPCFAEEPHLLDEASRLGATEELCFVRAALGAMQTLDYFPKPDLCIAGVGSCCDDFSAVMQLIEWQGQKVHWWEIPARLEPSPWIRNEPFRTTPFGNTPYQESAVPFLMKEYRGIVEAIEETAGIRITDDMIRRSLIRFNEIRGLVRELRELVYGADRVPLPGLEMFLAEFIGIHACSEPEESVPVLKGLIQEARRRIDAGVSPLEGDPVRIYWVTPPTDASIVTALEDLGGCITGTEYLISHSYMRLRENVHPLEALAENYMDDPMIGSSLFRARRIVEEAKRFRAEGILISGIFGASHCPFEEKVIAEQVEKELNVPVVAFDVPYCPSRLSEQVKNRLEGLVEVVRSRRSRSLKGAG
jgi:benzoyl-CoA reductase/2-hydroxyglutaryl-CoA dehydratase subunit BcrC/BadD/HgdB